MLVSPWRRRQASAEAARRRNAAETYTEPLGAEAAQSDRDFADMKEFMKEFYGSFYDRESKRTRDELLVRHPEVAAHLAALVPSKVTEEEFWQRYDYRCGENRILREWERNPDKGRQVRAEAIAGNVQKMNLLDASVNSLRNIFSGSGNDAGSPADAATTTGSDRGLRASMQKEKEKDHVKAETASESEQKLEASLKAVTNDVERWMKQDSKEEVAQISKEDVIDDKGRKSVTADNLFTRWFRPTAENAAGNGEAHAIVAAPSDDNKRATPMKESATRSQEGKGDSAGKSNPLTINPRAEGLRDAGKPHGRNHRNAKSTDGSKWRSSAPRPTKPDKEKEEQAQDTPHKAAAVVEQQGLKGISRASSLLLTYIKVKVARYQMVSGIGIALIVGFLANGFLKSSVNALCAVPSLAFVCGDVAAQMAVEVIDNTPKAWDHGDRNRKRKKNSGGRNRDGYYSENNNQAPYSDTNNFDPDGGFISSLLSSWMENTDLSQYESYADAGKRWDGNGAPAVARNNRSLPGGPAAGKSRDVVGFFQRQLGRRSTDVAEPNVVVHQHVHHVVHHVVHEIKQA